jgi:hypothetical protein
VSHWHLDLRLLFFFKSEQNVMTIKYDFFSFFLL